MHQNHIIAEGESKQVSSEVDEPWRFPREVHSNVKEWH